MEAIGKINRKSKKTNIVISYCFKKNFDKEGNYYDEYLGTPSDTKKATWILISLDHKLPRKLKENIIIIKKKKKQNSFSLLYLIILTFKKFIKIKFSNKRTFF